MMDGFMIRCEGINKAFQIGGNKLAVIKDISVDIRANEFVVFLGPGQCGKTTLINIISGLDDPSSGRVMVDGKEVAGPDPDCGVVFQKTALFPWMTVMGNVEFGPKVRGIDKPTRRKQAKYYIDLVGLSGFEKAFPIKLSGGMRQRVGIARAYCNNPSVMLMDEPFGHLDAQTRYLMQQELERIWEKEKRTVVFVTNNIEEAIYLADRIIVLSNTPSVIKREFLIDLPRPRNYVSKEFLDFRKAISHVVEITK